MQQKIPPNTKKRRGRIYSNHPDDAAWRYEQAMIDADIEGLPRDTEAELLIAEMNEQGLSPEQQIERIKQLFLSRERARMAEVK